MRTVQKYPLPPTSTGKISIDLPKGSSILSVREYRHQLHLFALTDTSETLVPRHLLLVSGEKPLDHFMSLSFIDSISLMDNEVVLHIFEYIE